MVSKTASSLSLKVLYSNQNRDDTLTYLEGDATKVLTLNKESVQNLDLDVNIILTKMHEQETLESVKSAMQAINSYIQTPEMEKDPVRPLLRATPQEPPYCRTRRDRPQGATPGTAAAAATRPATLQGYPARHAPSDRGRCRVRA